MPLISGHSSSATGTRFNERRTATGWSGKAPSPSQTPSPPPTRSAGTHWRCILVGLTLRTDRPISPFTSACRPPSVPSPDAAPVDLLAALAEALPAVKVGCRDPRAGLRPERPATHLRRPARAGTGLTCGSVCRARASAAAEDRSLDAECRMPDADNRPFLHPSSCILHAGCPFHHPVSLRL